MEENEILEEEEESEEDQMKYKILLFLFLLNLLLLSYNLVGDGNNWFFVIIASNMAIYYVLRKNAEQKDFYSVVTYEQLMRNGEWRCYVESKHKHLPLNRKYIKSNYH